jgi:hypothetical protein
LKNQWNKTFPLDDWNEIYQWREVNRDPCYTVRDWDFHENISSIYALQAGEDYLGLSDSRTGHSNGKHEICIYRGNGVRQWEGFGTRQSESFDHCSFVSSNVVASSSYMMDAPVRLWDLRNTRKSLGTLSSFPLDACGADLKQWPFADPDALPSMDKRQFLRIRRLNEWSSELLLSYSTCGNSNDASATILFDPIHRTTKTLINQRYSGDAEHRCCPIPLQHSSSTGAPSLLACSSWDSSCINLVDVRSEERYDRLDDSSHKRRKVSRGCAVVGSLSQEILGPMREFPPRDLRWAWDRQQQRLLCLSTNFEVFQWAL